MSTLYLKARCIRSLNVLKFLSHPNTGCNRNRLLQLYKVLILPKLDYGAILYSLANKSILNILNPIQSAALRLVTGAFRTSPVLSLCAEAALPPLHFPHHILSSNFTLSVAQSHISSILITSQTQNIFLTQSKQNFNSK